MDATRSLDPSDPAVLKVLLDTLAMQAWECLRQIGPRATLATLAAAMDCRVELVGATLDQLASIGLIRSHRARGAQRATTYSVACTELQIRLRPNTEAARTVFAALIESSNALHAELTTKTKQMREVGKSDVVFGFTHALTFEADDLSELHKRLEGLSEFLQLHLQRPREAENGVVKRCNYMFTVRLAPLAIPVLPHPVVAITAGTDDAPTVRSPQSGGAMLSDRELLVARELRDGRTRNEIATRLRVSPHTVHTHCKRLFKKLGIERASELHRFSLHPPHSPSTPSATRAMIPAHRTPPT